MFRSPVTQYIYPIFYEVQQCVLEIRNWVYTFIRSVFTSNGALHELQPLFVIGIAVAVIFVALILIKKVVWGK